jgi:hypothetical protein
VVLPKVPTLPTTRSAVRGAAVISAPVGAVQPNSSASLLRPLIIAALCLSLALFGVAATPARVVPWRGAAYFLHGRQLEFTMFGLALLLTATFAMLLTKG